MAIRQLQVKFYQLAKKSNSTLNPSDNYLQFTEYCEFIEPFDIEFPRLKIKPVTNEFTTVSIEECNYIKILGNIQRCYFITK